MPIPNIQQIINRIGTLKPKVFDIIDFTAGYHQTSLHPDSQEYTAFITQYELSLGKLVTEKPVDFVGFDNVVEFNKNRQNHDNVVKAYKDLFS